MSDCTNTKMRSIDYSDEHEARASPNNRADAASFGAHHFKRDSKIKMEQASIFCLI
jgi:hypothetical protein